jgi:hypothetical protein
VEGTLTLTNTGKVGLTYQGDSLVDPSNPEFSEDPVGTTCQASSTLAPGTSCFISIQFSPTYSGSDRATLELDTDAVKPISAWITGNAIAAPYASARVTPGFLHFGPHVIGMPSPPKAVTVTSTGNLPLTISSVSIAGSGFSIDPTSTCSGASLTKGQACVVEIVFRPVSPGPATGQVSISDNAGDSPQPVGVSGNGRVALGLGPSRQTG